MVELPIHPAPKLSDMEDLSKTDLRKEVLSPVTPEEFKMITTFEKGRQLDQFIKEKPEINKPVFINYRNSVRNMGTVKKIERAGAKVAGIEESGAYRITTELGTFNAVIYK